MDGIIWLLVAPAVALAVLAAVLVRLHRRSLGADQTSRHCPHCETPISMRRVSLFRSFMLMGDWVCPHCRTRLHKRRGKLAGTAN